jgi:ribose transport system permease protein
LTLGGGFITVSLPFGEGIRVPNPVLFLIVMALLTGLALRWTRWGRHVFAIGGNEAAANLTGVPVRRVKVSVYMFCSFCAGVAGILEVGWLGTISTSLGQGMELSVIAAAVIGGANLMGGVGTAFGAVVGAALIEVIWNSLILLGISTFWQGTFVGSFIIVAVLFDRLRAASSSE